MSLKETWNGWTGKDKEARDGEGHQPIIQGKHEGEVGREKTRPNYYKINR